MISYFLSLVVLAGNGKVVEGGKNNNFCGIRVRAVLVTFPTCSVCYGGGNAGVRFYGRYENRAEHRKSVQTCGVNWP